MALRYVISGSRTPDMRTGSFPTARAALVYIDDLLADGFEVLAVIDENGLTITTADLFNRHLTESQGPPARL